MVSICLDAIMRKRGTTMEVLNRLDPSGPNLKPGQIVKYQKARIRKVITGCLPLTTQTIAMRYNAPGDPAYAKKLDYCLAVMAMVLALSAGEAIAADTPFAGVFEGTGRACHGDLTIKKNSIAWLTPFSRCQRTPYSILERSAADQPLKIVYKLERKSKSCLYEYVVLEQIVTGHAPTDADWHATGYQSAEDLRTASTDSLGCGLVRKAVKR